jgi:hypothetical protein
VEVVVPVVIHWQLRVLVVLVVAVKTIVVELAVVLEQ